MKSWSQSSQKEKWKEKHNDSCPAKKGHLGDIQSQNRISDSQLSPELTFEKAKIKKKDIGHIVEEEMIIANSPFRKGILFWARDQVSHLIILATQGPYSIAWNQSNINKQHMLQWNKYSKNLYRTLSSTSCVTKCIWFPFIEFKNVSTYVCTFFSLNLVGQFGRIHSQSFYWTVSSQEGNLRGNISIDSVLDGSTNVA
jgi:hypothetical protein